MSEMSTLFLEADEISALTRYKRPAEQEKWLRSFGIPCQRRPDGSLCVLRCDLTRRQTVESRPRLKWER